MDDIVIMQVTHSEVPLLEATLQQLASDLGDDYAADQATLAAAVCGPDTGCFALLARQTVRPVGAVLAAPVFSTTRGAAGLFVSDLWVAKPMRGKGLARRLLEATLHEGTRRSAGRFLKLTVYHNNPGARAAYHRLGFTVQADETNMVFASQSLTN